MQKRLKMQHMFASHFWQTVLFAEEYEPAAQLVQEFAPSDEILPLGHCTQACEDWYCPAAQTRQLLLPVSG